LAGAFVVTAAVAAVVLTMRAGGLRTVEYGLDYVVACVLIDVICVAVVAHVHILLRGVDLDPRQVTSIRRPPPRRGRPRSRVASSPISMPDRPVLPLHDLS